MSIDVSLLRRPYTRTVAKDIRSIPILAASFEDVKRQWRDLLLECRNGDIQDGCFRVGRPNATTCSGTDLLSGAKTALATAEKLSSQLKAVKQELVVHLSQLRNGCASRTSDPSYGRADAGIGGGRADLRQPQTKGDGQSIDGEAEGFFAAMVSSVYQDGEQRSCEPFGSPTSVDTVMSLCRGVWLWSILLGCTLADLDLLAGSLSVAQNELFADRELLMTASSRGEQDGPSELVSFFFSTPTPSPSSAVTASEAAVPEPSDAGGDWQGNHSISPDAVFVTACSLVYNTVTKDVAAAARVAQRWTTFTGSLAALLTHSHVDPGADVAPVTDYDAVLSLLIGKCVSAVTSCLTSEDYGGAGRVLQSCATWFHSVWDGPEVGARTLRAFLLSLQLLLRLLVELDTRRGLIKAEVGQAYRPVITATADAPTDRDANGNGTAVRLACCVLQVSQALPECVHCRADPPPKLCDDDKCLAHWPRRIQLQRLLDVGGPWPLPADVVKSQFTFTIQL